MRKKLIAAALCSPVVVAATIVAVPNLAFAPKHQ
jgi:hypothetical protein